MFCHKRRRGSNTAAAPLLARVEVLDAVLGVRIPRVPISTRALWSCIQVRMPLRRLELRHKNFDFLLSCKLVMLILLIFMHLGVSLRGRTSTRATAGNLRKQGWILLPS